MLNDNNFLFKLIKDGNIDEIKVFLLNNKDFDLNIRNSNDETLLTYAIEEGAVDVGELFLKHGTNPNLKNKKGESPLLLSSRYGFDDFVLKLLSYNVLNECDNKGFDAAYYSVKNGHIDSFHLLESAGFVKISEYADGSDILGLACYSGNIDLFLDIKKLVEVNNKHLDIALASSNNQDGSILKEIIKYITFDHDYRLLNKMLEHFVKLNDIDSVSRIIECGGNQNHINSFGEHVLISSFKFNASDVFFKLIDLGSNYKLTTDVDNYLHRCVGDDNVDFLNKLLKFDLFKSLINEKDIYGDTPFLQAVKEDKIEFIEILLNAGANPLIKDMGGRNVIDVLNERYGDSFDNPVMDLMKKHDDVFNVENINADAAEFLNALREKDLRIVSKKMAEANFDINEIKDKRGNNIVMWLIDNNDIDTLEIILAFSGIDINATNDNKDNALTLISKKDKDTEIVKLLLSHDITIDHQNLKKETALMLSIRYNNKNLFDLLIKQKGIDLSLLNTSNVGAFGDAIWLDNSYFVERLVDRGVDITQNQGGKLPLIFATLTKSKKVFPFLVKALIKQIDGVDELGNTALYYAVKNGQREMVSILKDSGANPNIENKDGESALSLSVAKKMDDVTETLKKKNFKKLQEAIQ